MLIACNHTIDEITRIIGADTLGYLKVEDLGRLIGNECKCGYCDGCFTNEYPTEVPERRSKSKFETKLSEKRRQDNE